MRQRSLKYHRIYTAAAALVLSLMLMACGEKAPETEAQTAAETEQASTAAETVQSEASEPELATAPENSITETETLSPFQNFMESSVAEQATETTLSKEQRESLEASEQASKEAVRASIEAAEREAQAALEASMALEESIEASIDASIAESERIEQSIEESLAEEEMRLMNESADAEAAELEAGVGPGYEETVPQSFPKAPGM